MRARMVSVMPVVNGRRRPEYHAAEMVVDVTSAQELGAVAAGVMARLRADELDQEMVELSVRFG